MKIRGILMAVTVLMGMAAAAGCNDESTSSISRVEKRNESSVAEVSTTLDESAEGSDSSSEGDSDTAQDTTEKSAAQKAREEAREQAAEIQETRSDEEQEAPAGDEDTQKTAEEMFKKSCDTFWDTLINCGFAQIYVYHPFDCLLLYCANSDDPIVTLHSVIDYGRN